MMIAASPLVWPIVSHTDADGQEMFVMAPTSPDGVWLVQVDPPSLVPMMELTEGKSKENTP